jgi:DNA-binding transcriptional MerR regulator
MQIGTIAKRIGVTADAIRFYERSSLLPSPPRSAGGFRQYGEGDVETLGFIRRVQGLGFTLREIGELLELRRTRLQPCAPVCRRLDQKLSQVRRKLHDLHKLGHELRAALGNCKKELHKRSARCPLLRRPSELNRRVRIEDRSSLRA